MPLRTFAATALTALISTSALAADPVEGLWRTIDDNTDNAKSFVEIKEVNSEYQGTVIQIIDPAKRDRLCVKCKGPRKDQKIEGMTIVWGMQPKDGKFDNGNIVDPESGKEYSANMKLIDGGKKLEVRGYIGFSLIGRSQVWERADASELSK